MPSLESPSTFVMIPKLGYQFCAIKGITEGTIVNGDQTYNDYKLNVTILSSIYYFLLENKHSRNGAVGGACGCDYIKPWFQPILAFISTCMIPIPT